MYATPLDHHGPARATRPHTARTAAPRRRAPAHRRRVATGRPALPRPAVATAPSGARRVAARRRRRADVARRRLLLAASVLCGAVACGLLSDVFLAGSDGPAAAASGEFPVVAAPAVGATGPAAVAPAAPTHVVAGTGDSLWAIAERYHGAVPIGDYLDQLLALNDGAALRAGDLVVLPPPA